MDTERLAWIALAWSGSMGPRQFRRLLGRFGSAEAVLGASARALAGAGLSAGQIEEVHSAADGRSSLAVRLTTLVECGVRVICSFDQQYPEMLHIRNAPPVITAIGALPGPDEYSIAIVGTRTCTQEGFDFAYTLAGELARRGVWIVSGLALGIDTAGHKGALDTGGRTVAVVGNGIEITYPPENRDLAKRIRDSGGMLSESPPDARPSVARLMARNRLQSALAQAVIVVEARERGGSLVTAGYARRQGRLIFACEWNEEKQEAVGTRRLIAQGATPLHSPADAGVIIEAIRGWRRTDEGGSLHEGLFSQRRLGGGRTGLDF